MNADKPLMTTSQGYRVELLDAFASNSSLAGALGAAHALTGTWRSTVSDMRQVEQLTPADVQQVMFPRFGCAWPASSIPDPDLNPNSAPGMSKPSALTLSMTPSSTVTPTSWQHCASCIRLALNMTSTATGHEACKSVHLTEEWYS